MINIVAIEITKRLLLAVVISGAIGFDREFKNRPAGIRTHILVCLGAVVIALIQDQITFNALELVKENANAAAVIRTDQARLIAQVVSGIGFLGAGTIIVTKQSISGLTTAASLWAVACLGLAVGMGYYIISIISFIAILAILSALKNFIIVPTIINMEISYYYRDKTKKFIDEYFNSNNIRIKNISFDIDTSGEERLYTYYYTIELAHNTIEYNDVVEELSFNDDIVCIRLSDM